jgi:hypothetical protein
MKRHILIVKVFKKFFSCVFLVGFLFLGCVQMTLNNFDVGEVLKVVQRVLCVVGQSVNTFFIFHIFIIENF